ncbi:MAG: VWA domain-containing protein [Phycisphaeraceae bacterium]
MSKGKNRRGSNGGGGGERGAFSFGSEGKPAQPATPKPETSPTAAAMAKGTSTPSSQAARAPVTKSPSASSVAGPSNSEAISVMDRVRGKEPLPYTKLSGETAPSLLFTIALVVSTLMHVALAVALGQSPIGRVHPPLVEEDTTDRFRVYAPPVDDPIYSDPILNDTSGPPVQAKQPGLGEMGKMLLMNRTAPGSPIEVKPPKADPVNYADSRPSVLSPNLTASSAELDLPQDVTAKLTGGGQVAMPITSGAKLPDPSKVGTENTGATAANTARDFLKGGIGKPGIGIAPPPGVDVPSAPARPIVADAPPTMDRRLLQSNPVPPPIEVAAIAIRETNSIEVPERLDEDFDYQLSKFRPNIGGNLFESAKPDRYTYFKLDFAPRRSLRKLKTMPKDVVFLIDTSGSVPQEWVNNMSAGVRDALGTLNEGDRFNIVFFAEKPAFFEEGGIAQATQQNIARAQSFLQAAQSKGDTDMNRALSRLLTRDLAAQRAYYLVLISDGVPTRGVIDTRELINLITRDNDLGASIYCVGVGFNQNKELLNFLAYRNKGSSVFAKKPADAAATIRDLASRIRYPIVKDVTMNLIGLEQNEVFPHHLPNIHQGEKFAIFGRYEVPSHFTVRVSGHNGTKAMDLTFGGDLLAAPLGEKNIPEDWGFWKLHHLYSEIIREGEKPEVKAQIKELKDRFDLKTLY